MFRKLANVEILNLKIGAETQDYLILSPLRRKGYHRLSLPNFKIQSSVIDFAEHKDSKQNTSLTYASLVIPAL